MAIAQTELAYCLGAMGELDEAAAVLAEAEASMRAASDADPLMRFLFVKGELALSRNDTDSAERIYIEYNVILAANIEQVGLFRVTRSLEGLAVVADRRGQADRALRLAGAADRMRDLYNIGRPEPQWRNYMEQAVANSRGRAVDPEGAWAEGSRWSAAEAFAYLQDEAWAEQPAAGESPLTPREWQVAELVAAGFTNSQIAGRLSIGTRTVAVHLTNMRKKLDLPSRAHVVAWVVRNKQD